MASIDDIEKSLGLPPIAEVDPYHKADITVVKASDITTANNANEDNVDTDYTYARGNYYSMVETGVEALQDMLSIAQQSQDHKAYETVSSLMRAIMQANKELVGISSEKHDRDKKREAETGESRDGGVVNNNLFVGTTADLENVLANMKKNAADKK